MINFICYKQINCLIQLLHNFNKLFQELNRLYEIVKSIS